MDVACMTDALDAAARLGAAEAEIVSSRDVALEIEVAKGQVETLIQAESIGAGVRLFTADHRMGFAYSTCTAEGVTAVVESAWQNALANDPDEHNVLPQDAAQTEDDWSEEDFDRIPVADKIEFCRALESQTLAMDPRIAQVEKAGYWDGRDEYIIVNSRGLCRRFASSLCGCFVTAAAAQPGEDSERGWEIDHARKFAGLRPDWVARQCAERATQSLGGRPCGSGAMPIVLDSSVATEFLNVIGPAVMANSVLKGKSLFAQKMNEPIAAPCVHLVDQNDLEAGLHRAPFDGEGVSARPKEIVRDGILRAFLHNAYTASRMGVNSTANAVRGGFRSGPEVGPTNFCLVPGTKSRDDLIAEAGNGLYVTEAMGVHMANPVSGDFSLGAAGLRIENGRLAGPVRGVTIAGNIRDLLKDLCAVGNDLRFFGSYGAPSVLVSRLMVSGK